MIFVVESKYKPDREAVFEVVAAFNTRELAEKAMRRYEAQDKSFARRVRAYVPAESESDEPT